MINISSSMIFDANGSMLNTDQPDFGGVQSLKKSWREFNDFYQAFIRDIDYYYGVETEMSYQEHDLPPEIQNLREQLTKYKGELTRVPAISQNLMNILKVLKEEEKYEINNQIEQVNPGDTTLGTLSESHEYFVEYKVLETLATYAITDEP